MKKLSLVLFFIFGFSVFTHCKSSDAIDKKTRQVNSVSTSISIKAKPKLVVGIIIDQMRYDYLTRFWDRYEAGGFKRLISEGYNLKNAHYNYVPTFTAPGHASIWTGTTPRYHGVIGNSYYDKVGGKRVAPVANDSVLPIGTKSSVGKRSPKMLLASTVGDENRLATQFRGKTIGVALKDRASILSAGHSANAAYWFHGKDEGNFITSSYYMNELPAWVEDFNTSRKIDNYLKTWTTLYPISTYKESGEDSNDFEGNLNGKTSFPYDIKKLSEGKYGYDILTRVTFGNNLTTDFVLAAIDGEDLGQDDDTDFLTISYSSPDYIGHRFGVNSKEAQDNYLRLDQEIKRLLEELDKKVGEGNYTVFLTADHGGVNVPAYLESKKLKAGYFNTSDMRNDLIKFVKEKYASDDLIANISNRQVFFDYNALAKKKIERVELENVVKQFLINYPKIAQVYTRESIENSSQDGLVASRVRKGFNSKRSGDVVYELNPAVISYSRTGSQHGSAYKYDTHVPMIFYGTGINKGQSTKRADIVDIAPTISALLGISFPNAATGEVLYEVID